MSDQLDRCRAYAVDHGWEIVGEFTDDGRSGLLDRHKRPGLDAALTAMESADVLVTLWTSRLSREERQRAELLDFLDALRVDWHAVADGGRVDRSTYTGYITYGINTLLDVAHSKRVRENWHRVHERRLAAGLPKTSSPRFGYRVVDGTYVVDTAEGEVVRDLYRRYTRGEGFTPLVTWLNESGWHVAGSGGPWTVRTLSRFMESGFAAGFISREDEFRHLRGAHDPLISEADWPTALSVVTALVWPASPPAHPPAGGSPASSSAHTAGVRSTSTPLPATRPLPSAPATAATRRRVLG